MSLIGESLLSLDCFSYCDLISWLNCIQQVDGVLPNTRQWLVSLASFLFIRYFVHLPRSSGCLLKADGHLQGLYSHIWLLNVVPRTAESLKTKSTLDQKLLVIVHHRFGWNFHLRLWRITDVRNHKPEIVNSNCGRQQLYPLLAAWWNCVST